MARKPTSEERHRRALQRPGTDHPVCCECGETYVHCLERDHVAGQHFGEETAILCRNCHRKRTDAQKDHPDPLSKQPSMLERIGHFLMGLADFFKLLSGSLTEFGKYLINRAALEIAAEIGDYK
jgi:hypothetical protein